MEVLLRVIVVIGPWAILSILIEQHLLWTPRYSQLRLLVIVVRLTLINPVVFLLSETSFEIGAAVGRCLGGDVKAIRLGQVVV